MRKLIKMSERDKIKNNNVIWTSTGLIAISLIILQVYISVDVLDFSTYVSLIAFSIAIPLLTYNIVHYRFINDDGYYVRRQSNIILRSMTTYYIGVLCTFIGINATIWHITWIAGLVFMIVSIFCLIILGRTLPNSQEIESLQREDAERERALE